MNHLIIFTSLLCFLFRSNAQNIPMDRNFLDHLVAKNLKQDIGLYAENMLKAGNVGAELADSLHFMLGKLYLDDKRDSSINHFLKVSLHSPELYLRSKKHLLYQYAWTGRFDKARLSLGQTTETVIDDTCGYSYLRFALAVLDRDNEDPLATKPCTDFSHALDLAKIDATLTRLEHKSPFVAACLSTILPGLGKVYAGRPGQGLMALLSNSIFALQAWEGYDKGGLSDPRFIVFSSLFTVFYIGNIWGSALSVKVNYRQTYDENKTAILATFKWTPGFKSSLP